MTSSRSLTEANAKSLANSSTSLSEINRAAMRRERRPLRESRSIEEVIENGEGKALYRMILSAPLT